MSGSTLEQIREREAPGRITSVGCSWCRGVMKPMFPPVTLVVSKSCESSHRVHASCCSTLHHFWSQLANSHTWPFLGPRVPVLNLLPGTHWALGVEQHHLPTAFDFPTHRTCPTQHSFTLTTCSSVTFTPICRRETPLVLLSACPCLDNHLTAILSFTFLRSKSSHSERCQRNGIDFYTPLRPGSANIINNESV